MKTLLKTLVTVFIRLLSKTSIGRFVENLLIDEAMNKVTLVNHNGCQLLFTTPNPLTRWRAETFSQKEPETLEWIDNIEDGSVLWDIGANVGLYSIYAAKYRGLRVYGFEPSVFNLELLGRNCAINNVVDRVTIIPLALSDQTGVNTMRHSSTGWGGALSSFGVSFGADGNEFNSKIEYATFGVSADEFIAKHDLPNPDYIKIDVDGIEHLVLAGAKKTILSAKSILIEINLDFSEQALTASTLLKEAGFKLQKQKVSVFTNDPKSNQIENQIWTKS